jgi:hypothetical protein
VALLARDLRGRGLRLAVLKHRLGWVAERRALFGASPPGPAAVLAPAAARLLSHPCYIGPDGPRPDPERAAQPERRDHAGIGPR